MLYLGTVGKASRGNMQAETWTEEPVMRGVGTYEDQGSSVWETGRTAWMEQREDAKDRKMRPDHKGLWKEHRGGQVLV